MYFWSLVGQDVGMGSDRTISPMQMFRDPGWSPTFNMWVSSGSFWNWDLARRYPGDKAHRITQKVLMRQTWKLLYFTSTHMPKAGIQCHTSPDLVNTSQSLLPMQLSYQNWKTWTWTLDLCFGLGASQATLTSEFLWQSVNTAMYRKFQRVCYMHVANWLCPEHNVLGVRKFLTFSRFSFRSSGNIHSGVFPNVSSGTCIAPAMT